jgi:hypothetical protein
MKIDIVTAEKLVEYYSPVLIGSRLMGETKIQDIVITPTKPNRFKRFFNSYKIGNYKSALLISGFDKMDVLVKVIGYFGSDLLHYDLDRYLSDHGIKKIYHIDEDTKQLRLDQE